ncbi:MAG: PD-(D/E)XK nuclease family protein [Candidatus Aminicenantes bacterium]|nr:PD-(D/E)XK nuclease family protein [Candidatus Aminicenantes bacterium]
MMNGTLRFLAQFCREHLLDEKILIVPRYQAGHQVGEALVRAGQPWVNLRFATAASLAYDAAAVDLAKRKMKRIADGTAFVLVNNAFRALQDEGAFDYFDGLRASPGIVRSLWRTILALRMEGVTGDSLSADAFIDRRKGREIGLLLGRYERMLTENRFVDTPGLFRFALECLGDGGVGSGDLGADSGDCRGQGPRNYGAGQKAVGAKIEKEKRHNGDKTFYLYFDDTALSELERRLVDRIAGDSLVIIPGEEVHGVDKPRRFRATPANKNEKDPSPSSHQSDPKGLSTSSSKSAPEQSSPSLPTSDLERASWLFAPYNAPPPVKDGSIELLSAVGPANEIKEVLRRITQEQTPLDGVEILHPSGSLYPDLFFILSRKKGIPATYGRGIHAGFTGPGKALIGLIDWLASDFEDKVLWKLIESGELKTAARREKGAPSKERLARLLKLAGIGWGKERYEDRLKKLKDDLTEKAHDALNKGNETEAQKYQAQAAAAGYLMRIVEDYLLFLAALDGPEGVDFSVLCRGLAELLKKYARVRTSLDGEALAALTARLSEHAVLESGEVDKQDALEMLRKVLEETRVGASGPVPGYVHLSSYESGGWSGRRRTFILGLSRDNFPGTGIQDPFLLDEEKAKISGRLQTSTDAVRENLFSLARTIASLRGKLTLSYPSYDIEGERPEFPSSVLLQALRLVEGKPDLDYSALEAAMEPEEGFFPEEGEAAVDDTDWWLGRLEEGGRFLDGRDVLGGLFPAIGQGFEAEAKRQDIGTVGVYDGFIGAEEEGRKLLKEIGRGVGSGGAAGGEERGERTGGSPASPWEVGMSASRFEALGNCPHQYFLRYVLGIEAPEVLEYDPARWLDALQRGTLIHEALYLFMSKLKEREESADPDRHRALIQEIGEQCIAVASENIPPPSEAVFDKEKAELKEVFDIFLTAEAKREERVEPYMFEVRFGGKAMRAEDEEEAEEVEDAERAAEKKGDEEEAVLLPVSPEYRVRLSGRIDRIDRLEGGRFRVVDYKSGSYSRYEYLLRLGEGKILQHALYAMAADEILRRKGLGREEERSDVGGEKDIKREKGKAEALVTTAGYYFPSRRGEGREILVKDLDREELYEVLGMLLAMVRTGCFIPSPNADCAYCDYRPICGEAVDRAKEKRKENPGVYGVFEELKKHK